MMKKMALQLTPNSATASTRAWPDGRANAITMFITMLLAASPPFPMDLAFAWHWGRISDLRHAAPPCLGPSLAKGLIRLFLPIAFATGRMSQTVRSSASSGGSAWSGSELCPGDWINWLIDLFRLRILTGPLPISMRAARAFAPFP